MPRPKCPTPARLVTMESCSVARLNVGHLISCQDWLPLSFKRTYIRSVSAAQLQILTRGVHAPAVTNSNIWYTRPKCPTLLVDMAVMPKQTVSLACPTRLALFNDRGWG